jgi:hypothetical protein
MIVGALLIIAGKIIIMAYKKRPSKGKRIAAGVCIGIGVAGYISAVPQLLLH